MGMPYNIFLLEHSPNQDCLIVARNTFRILDQHIRDYSQETPSFTCRDGKGKKTAIDGVAAAGY